MKTVSSRVLPVRAFVASLLSLAFSCQLLAAEKAGPEHAVINCGFGGSQIAGSVCYADREKKAN